MQSPIKGQKPLTDAVNLSRIRQIAETHFSSAPGSHDWEHTLRVHRLCLEIGPIEGADMLVLEAAAYLHDIGRSSQDNSNGAICHAAKGAKMAAENLFDIAIKDERKRNIVHCIKTHRFRNKDKPVSIEAKTLFDADKLDAIGAVGIARAYLFAGELGACLHNPHIAVEDAAPYSKDDTGYREYVVKLSQVKDRMLTREGKRRAENRHTFMETFFERFLDEYDGKC
jgi:uncharacterized protein